MPAWDMDGCSIFEEEVEGKETFIGKNVNCKSEFTVSINPNRYEILSQADAISLKCLHFFRHDDPPIIFRMP